MKRETSKRETETASETGPDLFKRTARPPFVQSKRMTDYVKMYKDAVKHYRELHPGPGKKLQKHHVWPVSLGGENKPENYVYVKKEQHRHLHTLLNLALLQSGNKDALISLDYSQMVPFKNLDISMFRNSRFVLERRGVRLSMSLDKVTELCRMLYFVPGTGNPPPKTETRWRVLTAAMFGNKCYGFRMSLELHRRKDADALRIIAA